MAQHDEHVGSASPFDQRPGQPAFADAGLAPDEGYTRVTGAGRGEARLKDL
jgi:hypothetical protein